MRNVMSEHSFTLSRPWGFMCSEGVWRRGVYYHKLGTVRMVQRDTDNPRLHLEAAFNGRLRTVGIRGKYTNVGIMRMAGRWLRELAEEK